MNKSYNMNRSNKVNVGKIVGSVLVCFMLVSLAVYGIYFNIKANNNQLVLQNQYRRTMTDMTDYVSQAEEYLLKAMAAGTPGMVSGMLENAARCSAQAESCLASLPIDQHTTEKISNYLVQLGDIASCWSHRAVDGGNLTEKEYETLSALYGYAQDLNGIINSLEEDLSQSSYTWNKIDNSIINRISEPFTDYPQLSYAGKYSVPDAKAEPKWLSGREQSKEQCRSKAIKYYNSICTCPAEEVGIEACGENTIQNINTYCYKMSCGEGIQAEIDVTKKGCKLYSMLVSRRIGEANLSAEQGIEAGKSFLKSIGLNNMKETTHTLDDNAVTVTYVYEKDGILYYPDAVKVKIALDNGMPVAYEGRAYILSHWESKDRLSNPSISKEDAKSMLSAHFKVSDTKEVVVPDNHGGEYHAYEFSGTVSGHPVCVYVNADSGTESDITLIY